MALYSWLIVYQQVLIVLHRNVTDLKIIAIQVKATGKMLIIDRILSMFLLKKTFSGNLCSPPPPPPLPQKSFVCAHIMISAKCFQNHIFIFSLMFSRKLPKVKLKHYQLRDRFYFENNALIIRTNQASRQKQNSISIVSK